MNLHRKIATAVAVSLLTGAAALSTAQAADVRASASVDLGAFFGRIDIGGLTPPPLMFPTPVVIQAGQVRQPPVYLRVPPGHAKHWDKHCGKYQACGQPVYFVQEDWYQGVYMPSRGDGGGHPGKGGRGRHDDRAQFSEQGHGNGHGKGHGKGKGRGHND